MYEGTLFQEELILNEEKYKPLPSLKAICEAFKQPEAVIKAWAKEGAPIKVTGQGNRRRYLAEETRLWEWVFWPGK